jgi:3-methyladenine DNA glycosylase AlkD
MNPTASFLIAEILSVANPERAAHLQRFFKTGKGEYAEGDILLGLTVPVVRDIVRHNADIPLSEIQILLNSEYHEVRLAGFMMLVAQFKKADKNDDDKERQRQIYNFYLFNARRANNWDLVDCSCMYIVGAYLLKQDDRNVLYRLAESDSLWEQRISIVSTWAFIKRHQYEDTLALAVMLLPHKHDLIHKAVGWMLREIGKYNRDVLIGFLEMYKHTMPRTTLRYAIEHFSPEKRTYFMKKPATSVLVEKNVGVGGMSSMPSMFS